MWLNTAARIRGTQIAPNQRLLTYKLDRTASTCYGLVAPRDLDGRSLPGAAPAWPTATARAYVDICLSK